MEDNEWLENQFKKKNDTDRDRDGDGKYAAVGTGRRQPTDLARVPVAAIWGNVLQVSSLEKNLPEKDPIFIGSFSLLLLSENRSFLLNYFIQFKT